MNWAIAGVIAQACLTIFIAAAAVYIAYQQYATNRRQLRLALFEKRLTVYEAVWMLLVGAAFDKSFDYPELMKLKGYAKDHQFLFGKEVSDYIDEIYKKVENVRPATPPAEEPESVATLREWFAAQEEIARAKFFKYMDFTKP
jgi:hypothetical protein